MAEDTHPGYYQSSPYPVEAGGPRREKRLRSGGLDIGPEETLTATARETGRWNVMFVWREPGELYLYTTSVPTDPDPHGLVERVDPKTLEPVEQSPELDCGGHVYCGGLFVHANGDLYLVNGNHLHRLSPGLEVLAERELPRDRAYNGALTLADGRLLTKDCALSGEPSTFVLLDPMDLSVEATVEFPEPAMGRIVGDLQGDGSELLYVPGNEHVFRYRYRDGAITHDPDWQPRYRQPDDEQGRTWECCLGDGQAWFLDNGDPNPVHGLFDAHPVGSELPTPEDESPHPSFDGAERLLRVDTGSGAIEAVEPTGEVDGWNIAPPLYDPEHGVAVAHDTGNGGLAAYEFDGDGLEPLWTAEVGNWWQPFSYSDTAELVVDDFDPETDDTDDVVVLDLLTGEEKGRADTGAPRANGMFPCPGLGRELYYTTFGHVARIEVV